MSDATSTSSYTLTNTLVLALAQCEQQNRRLGDQAHLIEQLREENSKLKKEIEQISTERNKEVQRRYAAQFQEVFEQVATKQAEIDHLKEKVRAAKVKAQRAGVADLLSSSPALPPTTYQHYTPRTLPSPILSGRAEGETDEAQPAAKVTESRNVKQQPSSRKRSRSQSQQRPSLRELDPNIVAGTSRIVSGEVADPKKRLMKESEEAAISEIAEDDDNYMRKRRKGTRNDTAKTSSESIYNRLGNLLDGKAPTSPRLLGDQSSSKLPKSGFLLDSTPSKLVPTPSGLPTPSTDSRFKRPRSSLPSARRAGPSPSEQKPLRSRPIDQLQLRDFKLNPASNAGLEYAYNETIRGEERKHLPGCTKECCINTFRALAATLPGFSGQNGQQTSEHDLLLNYLGPGSEEKIRNLTPKARENLVHDARTKLVADAYGKVHRDVHERGRSPPGFWRTDMPGSQEERSDLALAKAMEKEEVERRYHESRRENGRWMFADE